MITTAQLKEIGLPGLLAVGLIWAVGQLKSSREECAEIRSDYVDYVTMTVEVLKGRVGR